MTGAFKEGSFLPIGFPAVTYETVERVVVDFVSNPQFARDTNELIGKKDSTLQLMLGSYVDVLRRTKPNRAAEIGFFKGAFLVWRLLHESNPDLLPVPDVEEFFDTQFAVPIWDRVGENGALLAAVVTVNNTLAPDERDSFLKGAEAVYNLKRLVASHVQSDQIQ
jgi:hypothetical protein